MAIFKQKAEYKNFIDLLEQNAGLSYEKQLILADIIGEADWQIDMESGLISFGELSFPIQIIGSLSFFDNSWMWGWANTQSEIPDNLLQQAKNLKTLGEEKNIKQLKDSCFLVEEGFEHKVGMIACGIFNSKAYYCANYGEGVLVITIDDEKIPSINKDKFEKIPTVIYTLTANVNLKHKEAVKNYLIDRDFLLDIEENKIKASRNKTELIVEFDNLGRLKKLNGEIKWYWQIN